MNFHPRKVPRAHVRVWFAEALELSKRRVLAFLALGLGTTGIHIIDGSGLVLACVFPLILSVGCTVARSADQSKSALTAIGEVTRRAWIRVFMVGSTPWVLLTLFGLVAEVAVPGQPEPFSSLSSTNSSSSGESAIGFMVMFSVFIAISASVLGMLSWVTRFLWFLWTLCVVAELPLSEAFWQAYEGASLNGFVIWPYAVSVLLLLITVVLVPALFFPWLAITTSMMYVAYRDVWLAKSENSTVRFKTPINAVVTQE